MEVEVVVVALALPPDVASKGDTISPVVGSVDGGVMCRTTVLVVVVVHPHELVLLGRVRIMAAEEEGKDGGGYKGANAAAELRSNNVVTEAAAPRRSSSTAGSDCRLLALPVVLVRVVLRC